VEGFPPPPEGLPVFGVPPEDLESLRLPKGHRRSQHRQGVQGIGQVSGVVVGARTRRRQGLEHQGIKGEAPPQKAKSQGLILLLLLGSPQPGGRAPQDQRGAARLHQGLAELFHPPLVLQGEGPSEKFFHHRSVVVPGIVVRGPHQQREGIEELFPRFANGGIFQERAEEGDDPRAPQEPLLVPAFQGEGDASQEGHGPEVSLQSWREGVVPPGAKKGVVFFLSREGGVEPSLGFHDAAILLFSPGRKGSFLGEKLSCHRQKVPHVLPHRPPQDTRFQGFPMPLQPLLEGLKEEIQRRDENPFFGLLEHAVEDQMEGVQPQIHGDKKGRHVVPGAGIDLHQVIQLDVFQDHRGFLDEKTLTRQFFPVPGAQGDAMNVVDSLVQHDLPGDLFGIHPGEGGFVGGQPDEIVFPGPGIPGLDVPRRRILRRSPHAGKSQEHPTLAVDGGGADPGDRHASGEVKRAVALRRKGSREEEEG